MRFVFVFLLLTSINVFSQYKNYTIGPKGDTLNRVDKQGKKQGPWVIHVDEVRGERGYEEEGYFENDRKEGRWRRYSLDGDLLAIENYRWGNKNGKCQYYTKMGDLVREESWKAVNPDNPYDTVDVYDLVDPTKVVGTQIIKLDGFSLKHGTWKYFDPNFGTIVKTEKWFLDKPATGDSKNDDDLRPIDVTDNSSKSDTAGKKTMTKPQAVLDYEKKNSGKKKIKVRDGRTGY
ncbi:MAG TPA: hypothetical protein VGQ09_00395 [Chitinophagaceae bacterium]|jgi:hypothetical protein|nr:hypothetical protein [Chitinophagaceae bacterium]